MSDRKQVYIKTFGCQMNVYDSERISEALHGDGYDVTDSPEAADLMILNTCHIREKAAEKVYSDLGRLRGIKDARAAEGKDTMIAVAGCVAQAESEEMVRRAPVVDVVVGPQAYHRLPGLLSDARMSGRSIVDTEFPDDEKFTELPKRHVVASRRSAAFLTVQEGCDKFCTFCVVPYTRGAEYSRPAAALIDEARALVDAGVCEITLLGQNVNAYHGDGPDGSQWSLAQLLNALAGIPGLARLRYTTSHPRDMSDDLIQVHRDNDKVMPYLHLPFQAGSDRILAAMNRKHTMEEYFDIIGRIRAARPDLALSTDIIVGFPGETDDEFAQTMDAVRRVTFAQAYSFKYSARPGTPAANMEDDAVPEEVKADRLQQLQTLLNAQQEAFNRSHVGRKMPVLLERVGKKEGQLVGRSPWLQAVHVIAGPERIGQIVDVTIDYAGPNSLSGVVSDGAGDQTSLTVAAE